MLFNSKIKKLASLNVLAIALTNHKETPLADHLNRLKIEFSLPNTWKMQEGNTVFIVHRTPIPGFGYFKAFNADTRRNFIENCLVFLHAAYKVGFDHLVVQFNDPLTLPVFKHVFSKMDLKNSGYVVHKTTTGGFQVTMTLGPSRSKQ